MSKTALLLLADGCEETEATTVFDILVRAGIATTIASITDRLTINCSRGMTLLAQTTFSSIENILFDVVILPGGLDGAQNYRDSPAVIKKLQQIHQAGGIVAAICASPAMVLQHHNLFPTAKMTGYPTTQAQFPPNIWVNKRVYYSKDERILTSQGPGTSLDFGLELVNQLVGQQKAHEVAKQLVLPEGINTYS